MENPAGVDPCWWTPLAQRLRKIVAARAGWDAVDDVIQEVALAATKSEKLPDTDPQRSHFLVAVTIRQSALWLRKQYRDRSRQCSLDATTTVSSGLVGNQSNRTVVTSNSKENLDDPIYFLMSQEDVQQTRACFAALDEEARLVLTQKYIQRLSYQAMADQNGWTRHVAEYRVQLAKKSLKRLLVQSGLGDDR